jgi:hypothetical protein
MDVEDIDQRTISYGDVVKKLINTRKVKAAFINYINSELIIITREGFENLPLDDIRELLPMWLNGLKFPDDPKIIYSSSYTKIVRLTTMEFVGSPNRLKLMNPEWERIL